MLAGAGARCGGGCASTSVRQKLAHASRLGPDGVCRRWRSTTGFQRRSDVTRTIAGRDPGALTVEAPLDVRPRSTAVAMGDHVSGICAGKPGLGSAVVHGNYNHLGVEVTTPPFLAVPKTVSVIGAPMSWGQPRAGTDQGSQILRDCGMEGMLLDLEWRLDDHGDLTFDAPERDDPLLDAAVGQAKNCFTVGKGLKKIYDHVLESAEMGEFVLTLGGDHSISAGSVAAILRARPETGIIWVDAHGDLNTPDVSPSGNMHGMPLGLLLGLMDPASLPGFEWFKDVPVLKPEQLCFVGLRDLDEAERKIIRELNITAFTMQHVDRYGIGQVMEFATESMRMPDVQLRPLHLSYDIDAVDPELAPSTGTIVRGGLNYREAHYVAEAVSNTGMLGSMDLVEVNPKLCPGPESEMTAQLGMALIASAMGSRIL